MKEFRQLTVDDAAEYHEVLIAGYAENKNYPISFDAINFSPEESRAWILKYPVFGLYVDGSLVCSISFRMPSDSQSYARRISAHCTLCDGP